MVVSCKKVICFLEFNNCVCKFDKNKNKNLLKKYLVNKKKFTGGNNCTHKKVSECGKNIGARLAKYNSQQGGWGGYTSVVLYLRLSGF